MNTQRISVFVDTARLATRYLNVYIQGSEVRELSGVHNYGVVAMAEVTLRGWGALTACALASSRARGPSNVKKWPPVERGVA
eukprot:m.445188 g.445188  ORF g.445188 m.445188 type:complete len:82 (+) comp19195_c0_seq1:1692-1937(+)